MMDDIGTYTSAKTSSKINYKKTLKIFRKLNQQKKQRLKKMGLSDSITPEQATNDLNALLRNWRYFRGQNETG